MKAILWSNNWNKIPKSTADSSTGRQTFIKQDTEVKNQFRNKTCKYFCDKTK